MNEELQNIYNPMKDGIFILRVIKTQKYMTICSNLQECGKKVEHKIGCTVA